MRGNFSTVNLIFEFLNSIFLTFLVPNINDKIRNCGIFPIPCVGIFVVYILLICLRGFFPPQKKRGRKW